MNGNTFGRLFCLTTFGESHGPGLGGIVDGCPAGLPLSAADMQRDLDERRPGAGGKGGAASTLRDESDRIKLLSGVFEGKTTGTPIAFYVENADQHSGDYDRLAEVLRPGHADLGFHAKFGIRDHRGGGRASGRETLSRVAGGAVARLFLADLGITVRAYTLELGGIRAPLTDVAGAFARPFFAPDDAVAAAWEARVNAVHAQNDTLGGLVRIEAFGLPAGLGEPVFDKLDARLAYALMGVGAVKGVEVGRGFAAARLTGSEHNDPLVPMDGSGPVGESGFSGVPSEENSNRIPAAGRLRGGATYGFMGNNAGGSLGGMSSGAPLELTVAVKPISSIGREQRTICLDGEATRIAIGGRHDISAIPRIVPVLKAMTALTLADFVLLQRRQGTERG